MSITTQTSPPALPPGLQIQETHQHKGFDERRDHQQPTDFTESTTADELDARHGLQDGALWIRVCTSESPSLVEKEIGLALKGFPRSEPGTFLQEFDGK